MIERCRYCGEPDHSLAGAFGRMCEPLIRMKIKGLQALLPASDDFSDKLKCWRIWATTAARSGQPEMIHLGHALAAACDEIDRLEALLAVQGSTAEDAGLELGANADGLIV